MADAKLTALTAASALAAADLFYVSQSAASRKATGTQLLALVGTTYVPLAGGTMTGSLTLPAGAVGTPSLMFTGAGATTGFYSTGSNNVSLAVGGNQLFYCNTNTLWIAGATGAGLLGDNALFYFGSSSDTILRRDGAAATLAQRNGTTQQIFRLYNTYTDASNYERLTLTGVAGTSVNITAQTLGTGGDNLDIVLTPAGTGLVKFQAGSYVDTNGTFYTVGTFVAGTTLWVGATLQLRMGNAIGALWSSTANANGTVDTGLNRGAAGQVDVTNGTAGTWRDLKLRNLLAGGGNGSYVQTPSMTVANLAAAATAGAGARAFVTDANATTFLSTVAGGGSNKVPVVSDGTNWLIG